MRTILLSVLTVAAVAGPAAADTVEVTTNDDVEAVIATLSPGDELIVHGGTYTLTERFSIDLTATAALPIVIRAADGETPVFLRPDQAENIWDLDHAEYVTLRGLEFTGGSAGVRIAAGKFVTVEDCHIHGTGDVALRANDVGARYEGFVIRHNHIHDTGGTGEGMYLGCNDNGCQMFDSLIEGNWVHDTRGPAVSQGDGIELKEGSYHNVIRDNVIYSTGYPCIITYSTVGNGMPNVIERNAMWDCGDHAIQSAADATIRNNIILGSAANGIAMQPHQAGTPANLVVVHNTVLKATNTAIRATGITGSVVIANNAVYAQAGTAIDVGGDLTNVTVAGNVGTGGLAGTTGGYTDGDFATDFVAASYLGAPPNDVFPAQGSALIGAGDATYVVADDFNGTPRTGAVDVGAYVFAAAGNPGWTIVPGFKDETPVAPMADAAPGTGPDAGGPGGGGGGCCDTGGSDPTSALAAVLLVLMATRAGRARSRPTGRW